MPAVHCTIFAASLLDGTCYAKYAYFPSFCTNIFKNVNSYHNIYIYLFERVLTIMELNSIAFIPDGNRRYASLHNISPLRAYSLGTQKAWDVLDWLVKYPQIKAGTFYTLSLENLHRSKLELSALFKIFDRELDRVKEKAIFAEHGMSLKFLGDLKTFPKKLQEKMHSAEKLTGDFTNRTIYLALGYNGQSEIVNAAKQLARDYAYDQVELEKINEQTFKKYLYSDFSNPDLIIRTSGTKRLSGFLTYQSAYSELYFLDKFWPEFTEQDLATAVADYEDRDRKFGK